MRRLIYQHILGFHVPVANSDRVDVGQASEHLISVEFDQNIRDHLFRLVVSPQDFVRGSR